MKLQVQSSTENNKSGNLATTTIETASCIVYFKLNIISAMENLEILETKSLKHYLYLQKIS